MDWTAPNFVRTQANHQSWTRSLQISDVLLRFKWRWLKREWGKKLRPNFALPPVKYGEVWATYLREWINHVQTVDHYDFARKVHFWTSNFERIWSRRVVVTSALSRISPWVRIRVRVSVIIVYRIAAGGFSWIWLQIWWNSRIIFRNV